MKAKQVSDMILKAVQSQNTEATPGIPMEKVWYYDSWKERLEIHLCKHMPWGVYLLFNYLRTKESTCFSVVLCFSQNIKKIIRMHQISLPSTVGWSCIKPLNARTGSRAAYFKANKPLALCHVDSVIIFSTGHYKIIKFLIEVTYAQGWSYWLICRL